MSDATSDMDTSPVRALRSALGLTLAEMGERCGISKSQMHEVERSGRASWAVALAIEALSGGRIDAALLNDGVKAARHGVVITPAQSALSAGKTSADSRQQKPLPACPSGSAAVFD